jgi:hypothetical protein
MIGVRSAASTRFYAGGFSFFLLPFSLKSIPELQPGSLQ